MLLNLMFPSQTVSSVPESRAGCEGLK